MILPCYVLAHIKRMQCFINKWSFGNIYMIIMIFFSPEAPIHNMSDTYT